MQIAPCFFTEQILPHKKTQIDKEIASEREEVLASFIVDDEGHLNRCIDLPSFSASPALSDVTNFESNGICERQTGKSVDKHVMRQIQNCLLQEQVGIAAPRKQAMRCLCLIVVNQKQGSQRR